MQIRSDHTHHLDRTVGEVWDAIGRTDEYRQWWPWLRRLDAVGLVAGDEWNCTVQPPVPYTLRFVISIDEVEVEVEDGARAWATVTGDIVGSAALVVSSSADGCDIRLSSALRPKSRSLRAVSTLAPWMARFGHDWVITTGLEQFRRGAG